MQGERSEHWIPRPTREVWRALTRHSELGTEGALLRFLLPGGLSATAGRITVYESQRTLECAWGGGRLRWELEARDGMTRLVFTRSSARAAALDWKACLESL